MLCLGATQPEVVVHVSPKGADEAEGTAEAPFATIGRAQRAVRDAKKGGTAGDITVVLADGRYELETPLRFGPEDGGAVGQSVSYVAAEGAAPIISGGRRLQGWTRTDEGLWSLSLDELPQDVQRPRQLFLEGKRLQRAQWPKEREEKARVSAVSEDLKTVTLDRFAEGLDLEGAEAELVVIQHWAVSRMPIVGHSGPELHLSAPAGWIGHYDALNTTPGKAVMLENAPEFVTESGEWCLDAKGDRLLLKLDEDPNESEVTAAALENLLVIEGARNAPVRNLHFKGVAFEHSAWSIPDYGWRGIQAAHYGTSTDEPVHVAPPALALAYAERCSFENVRAAHFGATGFGLGPGCRENVLSRCVIEDAAANGIVFGWRAVAAPFKDGIPELDADWASPEDVPRDNRIEDSVVRRCAQVFHGAVGIADMFCDGTRIEHNLVEDMPYTGVSVGYIWNEEETNQRNTLVAHNHIREVMLQVADGGGIYTLGYQPGSVLRGNYIHHVRRSSYTSGGAQNNGIFFDQGSSGFLVEENIIHDTTGVPMRFNRAEPEKNTLQNNCTEAAPGDSEFPESRAAQAGPRGEQAQ
jgi:hypothetical protein